MKKFATLKKLADKAYVASVATFSGLSEAVADSDFVREINTNFASAVSKAMDSSYLDKVSSYAVKMSPSNHRILDGGHTVQDSIDRAFAIGEKQGLSDLENFEAWAKAYFSDLSSPGGMPAFEGLTDDIYIFLRNLGVDDKVAIDLVTVNGQEALEALLGGTIAGIALILGWKSEDKDAFSKVIGSIGIGACLSVNPLAALIAVVAVALGYNKNILNREQAFRGAFSTGLGWMIGALIPGPALLGLIPALVIVIYVNRKLNKETPLSDQLKSFFKYVRSEEFKNTVSLKWEAAQQEVDQRISKFKTAA